MTSDRRSVRRLSEKSLASRQCAKKGARLKSDAQRRRAQGACRILSARRRYDTTFSHGVGGERTSTAPCIPETGAAKAEVADAVRHRDDDDDLRGRRQFTYQRGWARCRRARRAAAAAAVRRDDQDDPPWRPAAIHRRPDHCGVLDEIDRHGRFAAGRAAQTDNHVDERRMAGTLLARWPDGPVIWAMSVNTGLSSSELLGSRDAPTFFLTA